MFTWESKTKIGLGGKTSGLCPVVGYGIKGLESSCSAAR
jgi:hypothetical protein